jgi:hypothetical protein
MRVRMRISRGSPQALRLMPQPLSCHMWPPKRRHGHAAHELELDWWRLLMISGGATAHAAVLSIRATAHAAPLMVSHMAATKAARTRSTATARLLNRLPSQAPGRGTTACAAARTISQVPVRGRHSQAARLPLDCSFGCCHMCSVNALRLMLQRVSYHTWPSEGGTYVQRGYRSTAQPAAVAGAQH